MGTQIVRLERRGEGEPGGEKRKRKTGEKINRTEGSLMGCEEGT